ncbi:MAG: DUF4199 domain-containing protein [Bacteroidales bacterium]|jgi:hypothetical protein|nr:DUF4199 domain-containing protein [Bacteroidales bacterium]MDD4703747.1 DUF4199 domain-containing protein [Bacteroidales bacterium]MDX9798354.1 DUF4199 domain-containing protein [Bacteroidales bacterium]
MNTKNKSNFSGNYWSGILKYGLLIGLGLSLVVIIRLIINKPIHYPISYSEYFSLLIFMFIGVLLYRSRLEDGKICFKEAYWVALGSGIIGAIIYGIFIYVYASFIDSSFQGRYFDIQRAVEANSNLSDEQINSIVGPSSIAISSILFTSLMSIFWGLIVAVFLKNKKKELKEKEINNVDK